MCRNQPARDPFLFRHLRCGKLTPSTTSACGAQAHQVDRIHEQRRPTT